MAACSSPIPPASTPAPFAPAFPAASRPPATPTGTTRARPGTSPSTSAPPPSRSRTPPTTSSRSSTSPASTACASPPQGTGHNAGALDSLADTILLKTTRMRGVEIDAEARVARVAAGALWADVTGPPPSTASPRSPAPRPTSASSATRSAAARLARPQVRPGREQRHRHRGRHRRRPRSSAPTPSTSPTCSGRCAAAAATSASSPRIEFRLYPLTEVYAGMLFWPWERSAEVLKAWREWTRTAPDEVTTVGAPPPGPAAAGHPRVPAAAARSSSIDGAYIGDEAAGAALLQPLRDARPRDRHVRDDAAGRAARASTWTPRSPTPAHRRRPRMLARARRRGDRRARRRRRPGLGLAAADGRAPPPRRRARPRAGAGHGALDALRRRVPAVRASASR